MAAVSLTPADLAPFASIDEAKALIMIEDALALAARVAPCITDEDFEYEAAAKAILRAAILRWNESGTGAFQQTSTGPFSATLDTRQERRAMFWPSEITDLQKLCVASNSGGAFSIDTAACYSIHADECSLNFGALYCSCGADIAGFPLWSAP